MKIYSDDLVSVVTVVKNLIKQDRIEMFMECLESIHNQSYQKIEHIIVEGKSRDGTLAFLREMNKQYSFKLISLEDTSPWDGMNNGLKFAQGKYINFMNSDDCFATTEAVSIAMNAMKNEKTSWFFSESWVQKSDGSKYLFESSASGVFSCQGIVHQSVFMETDILKAINPFTTKHVTKENYLFMILLANSIPYSYSYEPLVVYREGGYSLKEYGGINFQKTKNDFGNYFYENIGKYWHLTQEQCTSMLGWHCFETHGGIYSYRISRRLEFDYLRKDFRRRLWSYLFSKRGIRGLLKRSIKLFLACRVRVSFYLKQQKN
jgi:glycosyltransferase